MGNRKMGRVHGNPRSTVRLIEQYGLELTHSLKEWRGDPIHWMPRNREVIFIGYLVHDDDCSDPTENCDGMGKFITNNEDRNFIEHVGKDRDGEPIIDKFVDLLARLRGVGIEEIDDLSLAIEMWDEAYSRGEVGTPYAVAVSYFGREGYVESTKNIDAVWIPDQALIEHLDTFPKHARYAEARRCFECTLEEHNKWVTCDTWGVVVDEFRRTGPGEYKRLEEDACWGYIGGEYAEEELLASLRCNRNYFLANRGKKEHAYGCEKAGPDGNDDRRNMGDAREEACPDSRA
jgi:hypothetical protein